MRRERLPLIQAVVTLLFGAVLVAGTRAAESDIELLDCALTPEIARQCFAEARQVCEADSGRLWGVSLCGPILLADPKTHAVIANQADREGLLKSQDGVYVGTLPEDETIAGTLKQWAGVSWVMLPWPLPKESRERMHFFAHEMFHRVQGQLKLTAPDEPAPHLNTRDGRIWLQLEWRALRAALKSSGPDRARAASDALLFRAYRRALFSGAATAERAQEFAEGLAEYTGVRLSADSESAAIERALRNVERAKGWPSFTRSFAYVSGPLYGLLLDHAKSDWRRDLSPEHDLGGLLQGALSISLPEKPEAEAKVHAKAYGVEQLTAAETARAEAWQKRIEEYRRRFVTGPLLVVPIRSMQFQFDPRDVHPLDDLGKVYPVMKMTDAWGILNVTGGALIANDWSKVVVPAPPELQARPLIGDGWTLELAAGWEVQAGQRSRDWVVRPK